ncbi:hypothetical protein [Streptomyces sp. NPDC048269]|uniref:hypothetical protein n=1 Tax=Streptomyces sp. NPDC048269 TaxID=3155753 RepID=UPI003440EAD9
MADPTSPARTPQDLDELIGGPPTISATPEVVNAIRNATGLNLTRTPVAPEHIVGVQP